MKEYLPVHWFTIVEGSISGREIGEDGTEIMEHSKISRARTDNFCNLAK